MDKTLKYIDDFLELLVLDTLDWSFGVSISMFVFILLWASGLNSRLFLNKENIFANSLLGATIQDGGIRERSNSYYWLSELQILNLLLFYFYLSFFLNLGLEFIVISHIKS